MPVRQKIRLAWNEYNKLVAQDYDAREDAADIQIVPGPPLGELVIRAEKLSKAFGDKLLFEDLNFDLPRGGIVGVIGPNGAGKTTLFKMIMGLEKPTSGELRVGETVSLSYVDQSRDALDPAKTVYEEIVGGRDFVDVGNSRLHSRAYVGRFNFKGQDQQKFVRELSGGERNRVHLAKLLRTGGNVMLLDEPTNDLDVETLRSLEEAIQNFGGCVVVSSHDRWFLDRLATHIWPSKVTAPSSGSRGITRCTRSKNTSVWVTKPTVPIGSSIGLWRGSDVLQTFELDPKSPRPRSRRKFQWS